VKTASKPATNLVSRSRIRKRSCSTRSPMSTPRWARATWGRIEASPVEDQPHGRWRHPVPEPCKLTVDASVAPVRVLSSEPAHQLPHRLCGGRATWRLGGWGRLLADHQLAVPAQQSCGLHEEHRPMHPGGAADSAASTARSTGRGRGRVTWRQSTLTS
jgi:hypothetical protein